MAQDNVDKPCKQYAKQKNLDIKDHISCDST